MNVLGYSVRWSHKPPTAYMGRFGGGWQWKVGIQAGGCSVIVSLLVAELRITAPKPEPNNIIWVTRKQHRALHTR